MLAPDKGKGIGCTLLAGVLDRVTDQELRNTEEIGCQLLSHTTGAGVLDPVKQIRMVLDVGPDFTPDNHRVGLAPDQTDDSLACSFDVIDRITGVAVPRGTRRG